MIFNAANNFRVNQLGIPCGPKGAIVHMPSGPARDLR